jgi:hypothetical protein
MEEPAMKRLGCSSSLLLIVSLALSAAASDDQQKAQKILNKITAMATDTTGRRAVSEAVSYTVAAPRQELAVRRHSMNLNYGEIFLAYQLVKTGAKIEDIGAELKSGKNIWQIAEEHQANWKQVANEAKKANSRIDTNLLKHFSRSKAVAEREVADGYDPFLDSVKADNNVTPQQIADAQDRYSFLHDHAGVVSGDSLDLAEEKAVRSVRPDPVREGGPQAQGENTSPGPK